MKAFKLNQFIEFVDPLIIGGEKHYAETFGPNTRYVDFEQNLTVVFDVKTREMYMIELFNDESEIIKRWVHPDHMDAYMKSIAERDWRFENDKPNEEHELDMIGYLQENYGK